MDQQEPFDRLEAYPSWFANRVQDRVAPLTNVGLALATPTTIECPAGPTQDAQVLNIGADWRFIEETIQRAHPGGAAGTYLIFATASAQDVDNDPLPFTDHTDYAFDLAIVADGATPAIVPGTVDVFRQVGELEWDGDAITELRQTINVPGAALADEVFDAGGDVVAARQPSGGFELSLEATEWVQPGYGNEPIEAIDWTGTGEYCRVGPVVMLRGVMDNGGSSEPMPPWFNLPAGFRPEQEMRFATWTGPGVDDVSLVIVEADGDVRGPTNAGGRLDGVVFRRA